MVTTAAGAMVPMEKARFSFGKVHVQFAPMESDSKRRNSISKQSERIQYQFSILCSRVELDASGLHSGNGQVDLGVAFSTLMSETCILVLDDDLETLYHIHIRDSLIDDLK